MPETNRETYRPQQKDTFENKKAILEAMLFVWEGPLSAGRIASILEISPEEAEKIIEELEAELSRTGRGIRLYRYEEGIQLGTAPEAAAYIEKMFSRETMGSLSNAALEALAIIAYKQPVTRVEIEEIRGVKSDGVVDNLLKRKLIKSAGRKETPGKPLLYVTTDEFLKYFGLRNLDELPPLPEED